MYIRRRQWCLPRQPLSILSTRSRNPGSEIPPPQKQARRTRKPGLPRSSRPGAGIFHQLFLAAALRHPLGAEQWTCLILSFLVRVPFRRQRQTCFVQCCRPGDKCDSWWQFQIGGQLVAHGRGESCRGRKNFQEELLNSRGNFLKTIFNAGNFLSCCDVDTLTFRTGWPGWGGLERRMSGW